MRGKGKERGGRVVPEEAQGTQPLGLGGKRGDYFGEGCPRTDVFGHGTAWSPRRARATPACNSDSLGGIIAGRSRSLTLEPQHDRPDQRSPG